MQDGGCDMSSTDRIRDYDLEVAYSLTCFKCGRYRAAEAQHPQEAAKTFTSAGWSALNGVVMCPVCKRTETLDGKEG